MQLERMDDFFNNRAKTYDQHMLVDLQLDEFYEAIANCFPENNSTIKLLDLGSGTGLQLDKLFIKMPDLFVTGIDLSQAMLNVLKEKYSNKNIKLICGSYFDVDFGKNCFDYVLSTYSLHHFSEEKKTSLYKKVFASLCVGGIFVEGDYTCKTLEQQHFYIAENERLRNENGITDGFYHYDTPFTAGTQINLLKEAGFTDIQLIKEWDNTSIITAKKE